MDQEKFIKESLEHYGFGVKKIPERETLKTPDFHVIKEHDEYTIELKTKYMNQNIIDNMNKAFDQGEMYTDVVPLDFTNKQKKVIHGAKKQLETEPLYPDSCHIAWFHCEGHDASTTMELFENALYGKAYVVDWKDGTDKAYECYYYHSNAMFSQYKDILDGAVISMDGSLRVLLNPYSPKYEQLKQSSLCSTFADGVQDPIEMEKVGEAIFVDEGMDRSNVHEGIKSKYSFKTLNVIPMKSYTITASLQGQTQ